jgi:multidrug efflux pump subunit AcrB
MAGRTVPGRPDPGAQDGRTIGLYREHDDLIPIIIRNNEAERANVGGLDALQVNGGAATETVPLDQVTDGVPLAWEDPQIWRRDRRTGTPFGFLALLGEMSLAGMMFKNAIVLLGQVNIEIAEGRQPYDATIEAALSRLRPVMLAAATTVLGVVPLLQDLFWVGMAITIMAWLIFGTLLTMIVVPTLYSMFYQLKKPAEHEQTVNEKPIVQPAEA